MVTVDNTASWYIWKLLRKEILTVLISRKEKKNFFYNLYEMMDINQTVCGGIIP